MKLSTYKKIKLPDKPGVYFFQNGKEVLYIGKATSIKDRTKSYFAKDLINTRGPGILDMVVQANNISYKETNSVLEALILEAELIKKYQPKYNVKEKDDKSWNYVCITREDIPKVVIKRGKELQEAKQNYLSSSLPEVPGGTHGQNNFVLPLFAYAFGPFVNGGQLKEAMKIIRRIFPYMDGDSIKRNNKEFYKQLGLVPESLEEYKKNIKNLILFFQGKKKKIILNFKKEMVAFAKKKEFEKANEIKKRIFALNHTNDVALIKEEKQPLNFFFRIEAYDVAHMSGSNMVGVMTVVENGVPVKSEYKKFIIKGYKKAHDTGALEEILSRRFRHTEWGLPSFIVVDGSIAQINVAKQVINRYQLKIPIVSVIKDEHHKVRTIMGDAKIVNKHKNEILLANNEAHRFAVAFYRQKSRKNMLK